jgi:hypothetical protein
MIYEHFFQGKMGKFIKLFYQLEFAAPAISGNARGVRYLTTALFFNKALWRNLYYY